MAENGRLYERVCADVLLRLDDWKTAAVAGGSAGQLRSLTAAGLVICSPDYAKYDIRSAHNHRRVYRRTKAGDRAAELLQAVQIDPAPSDSGSNEGEGE